MKVFEVIKKGVLRLLGRNSDAPARLPYNFAIVDYSKSAKTHMVFRDATKIINLFQAGKMIKSIPYSAARVEAIESVSSTPVLDLTQNKKHPDVLVDFTYTPGVISR